MRASLGKIVEIMYRKDVFFSPSRLRALSLSLSVSFSRGHPSVRTMINKTRRIRNCFETFVSALRRIRVRKYLTSFTYIR